MDFEWILSGAVLVTGILTLFNFVYMKLSTNENSFTVEKTTTSPKISFKPFLETGRAFFPILLLVLLFRSFFFEPFRIPSGSLEPSLLIGDFLMVNKYAYGIRLPVVHTKIWHTSMPKRGDIAVFRYPLDPSIDYIKRIIGLPGDHIQYKNKMLYINGEPTSQQLVGYTINQDSLGNSWPVVEKLENLAGIKHGIFQHSDAITDDIDVIVPPRSLLCNGR